MLKDAGMHQTLVPGSEAAVRLIHAQSFMSEQVASFHWAATPLGPIETWPSALLSTVNLILSSPQPALLIWGTEMTVIYNDGVVPPLGEKHPEALGKNYRDVFAEVWPAVGPDVEECFSLGRTTSRDTVRLPLLRNGIMQDDYYTYFLVPIYDGGRIVGVYNPFFDVTQQRSEQVAKDVATASQNFLLKLSDQQRLATGGRGIMQISAELLGQQLKVNRVGYAEVTPDGKGMSFETGWAAGGLKTLSGSVALNHWGSGTAAQFAQGNTVIYSNVLTEPGLASEKENYQAIGAIAVAAVPFLRRGVWRGSLYVNHSEPRQWTAQEIALIEEVALRTAEAVERAKAEEELRALADRLSMAQQTGRMASWEWSFATNTLTWDGGSEWTWGRPPSEMLLADLVFSYVHEDNRDKIQRDLMPAIKGTGEYRSEFRVTWPNGSIHWIQAFGRTVWSADGTPTGIVGINVNVTEQKQAEAALVQTEKLAAVGRLASTMAHEINNPLEAVTNLLYLARQAQSLDEVRPLLETADGELRRAATITSQALRFHRQASRPTLCSFQLLTADLLKGRHSRLKNAGASVEYRDRTSHSVLCFEGEIHQVLNNLVANAIDALRVTGGRLLLRGRDGTDWSTGQKGMVLTIADTGEGMPAATRNKVFDAFFTTKGVGGTGLGLWVSKEIIGRHAGSLRLRSSQREERRGTVFTFFLPHDAVMRQPND